MVVVGVVGLVLYYCSRSDIRHGGSVEGASSKEEWGLKAGSEGGTGSLLGQGAQANADMSHQRNFEIYYLKESPQVLYII